MGCRFRSGYIRIVRRLKCSRTAYAGVAGQCANTLTYAVYVLYILPLLWGILICIIFISP